IAMHFVNGQMENEVSSTEQSTEDLIEVISQKIEDTFQMELNRNEFNYNRLVMHLRYYIIRLQEEEQFMDSNEMLFQTMKENMPKVYHCAAEIAKLIQQSVGKNSTDDELL